MAEHVPAQSGNIDDLRHALHVVRSQAQDFSGHVESLRSLFAQLPDDWSSPVSPKATALQDALTARSATLATRLHEIADRLTTTLHNYEDTIDTNSRWSS